MVIAQETAGLVINLQPPAEDASGVKSRRLVKTQAFELLQLTLAAGARVPTHRAAGPIIVYCAEGQIEFTALGQTQELVAGQLLHLGPAEPHALEARVASSLLVTKLPAPVGDAYDRLAVDLVQEASEESFPASDPPARSPVVGS